MFGAITKLFTGYKTKHTVSNGLKIKVLYRGKLPSSDPLLILKEARLKLAQQPTPLGFDFDVENKWNQRLSLTNGKSPNSIASFQQESSKFKVSRYVFKEGSSRLSLYTVACDDVVFALFTRLYDFGKHFSEIERQALSDSGNKKIGTYLFAKDGYGALIDSLGQSQYFLWNNYDVLNRCFSCFQSRK